MGTFADDITRYACVNTCDDAIHQADSLQASVNALHAWGTQWHVRFEPSRSQLLRISCHREQSWPVPAINFGGEVIPQQPHLKLLGGMVDSKLSFSMHLRSVAAMANSRLGLLRRAACVLDCRGMLAVYHGFVQPLLEYAPLVWMGAVPTNLEHLINRVQRRALHNLGPNILLQSLEDRRTVAALAFVYKLLGQQGPPLLRFMVPPLLVYHAAPVTRRQCQQSASHPCQLENVLPPGAPNYLRRTFP